MKNEKVSITPSIKFTGFIRLLLLVAVLGCSNLGFAQFTSEDFLKANGTVLRNNYGAGDTINLRGTNLGSWLSMEYWMGPLGTGSLNRAGWEASASSTQEGMDPQAVFDRDLGTGWGSADQQNPDQFFVVDMLKSVVFNRISFEAGEFTDEYPRQYTIDVSDNQVHWETVTSAAGSTEGIFVQLPNIYKKRYIRVRQTGQADAKWSMAEFNAYMEDDLHVRNSLVTRFGEDSMDVILDSFQETWIQETDLDKVKEMGMNLVRVPFYWMEIMYNDGTIKPHGFDQLDWVIEECTERELYVILDLHGGPGGWNGFITSGQAHTNDLWTDPVAQQMTINIWKALAERYKGNPTVAAYDLMNEPLSSNQEMYPIHEIYNKIYQEVRKIDQDHVISIGAFPVFSFVVSPAHYGWENVLYQAHHYNEDKQNYDSQNGFIEWALRDMASYQHHWNVPILAGEFNFWSFTNLWEKYLEGANALNISWSNWAYKNKRVDQPVENWAYYDNNTNPAPNIHYDTPEEMAAKWSRFETSQFRKNTTLINTVSPLTGPAASQPPIGKSIWLKAYNGKYLSTAGGGPLTISRSSIGASELFRMIDAGEGKIALQNADSLFVTSAYGQDSLVCSSHYVGDSEKFTFINLGNGKMALEGIGDRFVSAENGVLPVTCNRTYIDGWEVFEWGDAGEIVMDLSESEATGAVIYPNPTDSRVYINAGCNSCQVRVFDQLGHLVNEYMDIAAHDSINVSDLKAGVYHVRIRNQQEVFNQKLIVK